MVAQRLIFYLVAFAGLAFTAPIEERASEMCGQYQSQGDGAYTLATNGWGWQYGTGSQCSEITGLSGNSISWVTNWTWSGGSGNVKSYTNVAQPFTQKALSAYTTIPISWNWTYTGTNIAANAAIDTFLGTSASGANVYEVMVWAGLFGGISPLSANGYPFKPIASPMIGGTQFDLAYGLNGNVKVYSFVAHSHADTTFSGDLLNFYTWLEANEQVPSSMVLQNIQAGTEVFTGTGTLTTTGYSISVK